MAAFAPQGRAQQLQQKPYDTQSLKDALPGGPRQSSDALLQTISSPSADQN